MVFEHIFLFFSFLSFWASKMSDKTQGKFLVNVLAWTDEIREIRSCNVRLDRSLSINVISESFATFLGCRITPIEPRLALVKYEPVRLVGHTSILIRLPKRSQWKGEFTTIECEIAEQPKHHIVLAKSTQKALKIYRQHTPYYPP